MALSARVGTRSEFGQLVSLRPYRRLPLLPFYRAQLENGPRSGPPIEL